MSEDLRALLAEADAVVVDCEDFLEAAVEQVLSIPGSRAAALAAIDAAREELERAREENRRVCSGIHKH